MNILNQYKKIKQNIEDFSFNIPANLIVVTKGRSLADIQKIINVGHIHFGENRVQESINKWKDILKTNTDIKLHFIGKLQTNKVGDVIPHFSFIHSLDNDKLALKLSVEEMNFCSARGYVDILTYDDGETVLEKNGDVVFYIDEEYDEYEDDEEED